VPAAMGSDPAHMSVRANDRLSSWLRFAVIVSVIVLDAIFEETLILGAELMMLLRWARDVLRYDVRWVLQEKVRLLRRSLKSRPAERSAEPVKNSRDPDQHTTTDAKRTRDTKQRKYLFPFVSLVSFVSFVVFGDAPNVRFLHSSGSMGPRPSSNSGRSEQLRRTRAEAWGARGDEASRILDR